MKQSSGERAFLHWWNMLAESEIVWEQQHRFHPVRKWRFDFAIPDKKVAVEVDGGVWLPKHGKKSRHTTGTGYQKDCEKLNAAVSLGWRVLRYTPQMLATNPIECIEQIKGVLHG